MGAGGLGPQTRYASEGRGRPVTATEEGQVGTIPDTTTKEPQSSRAPRRKVLAAGVGAGIGGNVAVVVAYFFPDLPPEVVAAFTAILLTIFATAAAYLQPAES